MARPIDSKKVIDYHRRTMASLEKAGTASAKYRSEVKNAADELIKREAYTFLSTISVDELNRDKGGIRVKLLHDNGIETIADVIATPEKKIEAIQGIGEASAHTIKTIANEIFRNARPGIKVKLSVDSKTKESTLLVTAILKYMWSLKNEEKSQMLLRCNKQNIDKQMQIFSVAEKSIKWLLASGSRKEKALDAYKILVAYKNGAYGGEANRQVKLSNDIPRIDGATAWKNFEKNPVLFINILEKICPGLLGNDDTLYGLPEDLALDIQEESLSIDGLLCSLRRYQEWGVKYALHQERVLLGDEMGLGKTVQAIAAMVSLKNTGETHFVVVCPASVLSNWCREITKMSRLSVTKIHGESREEAIRNWVVNGGVAVTTYETSTRFELPKDFKYAMAVIDEAHYIKNPEAKRTQSVKKLCEQAERLLFMTGTALENRVDEMISLIDILQPDIAQKVSKMAFMANAPQFREAVAPVYYRRKRDEVLTELPELIESKEWCVMTPTEEQEYEDMVLAKNYVGTRRVSWNIDNMEYSSKAQRMLELIEEAEDEGRKIIVFSFFLETIRKVTELLGGKCTEAITGSISPQRRQEIIDEFDTAPAGTVLVAQIQSGGTGLNIQSASVVILCEPQFKPSIENQAISRAYRMGQTRNVLVYRLLCEDSVDEKLMEVLENKQTIFDVFADRSVAAEESMEIDEKSFGNIIEEEIERISAKRGES